MRALRRVLPDGGLRCKAHVHLQDLSALDDALRCMALMQHHGAATRLLDFTKSPFVAAFFALNTPKLWSRAPDFDPALTRGKIDPRLPGNFERYFLRNELPVLWFGEPLRMDSRLTAQSGLFVLPGMLDAPLASILEHCGGSDELLIKYVLPLSIRNEAMLALYRMNVTYATLFPDLDGLARSVSYELEVVWEQLIEDYRRRDASDARGLDTAPGGALEDF